MSLALDKDPEICREFFWDVIELSQKDNYGLNGENKLKPVNIGGAYLYIDPNSWSVKEDYYPVLESKNIQNCTIQLNRGHGIGEDFTYKKGNVKLGEYTVVTHTWTNKYTGYVWIRVYVLDFLNPTVELRVSPPRDQNSESCLYEAFQVLEASEQRNFDN